MILEELSKFNNLLSENQFLVTFILVPIVSAIVAYVATRYATRTALHEAAKVRRHKATTQIATFRQAWINEQRNDLAEHGAICTAASVSTKDGVPQEKMYRLAELAIRISLRMNPTDEDYPALKASLVDDRIRISEKEGKSSTKAISQRILKREWDRLKEELYDNV